MLLEVESACGDPFGPKSPKQDALKLKCLNFRAVSSHRRTQNTGRRQPRKEERSLVSKPPTEQENTHEQGPVKSSYTNQA
ncbi:unnamed protein product [Echinostoma caproni]|uniref:Uncharacterized protein n=1 Tax=Echinostoma caproni TaxID=27848 RepID=A0A183A9Z7_9TREM|nr:unnamed protein product [Echinostoma caproni]